MAAEKDFSHHITRFWGIATYGLADDAPTVSNHFKEVSLEGHTEPDRINPQKLGEDRPLRLFRRKPVTGQNSGTLLNGN